MGHSLVRISVIIFALVVVIHSIVLAQEADRKEGTVYIHIIKQQGDKVLLQPIFPATLGFTLDNGQLDGQKFFECEQWRVWKTNNNVEYATLQLRCGGVVMTLGDVLMTEPK